MFVKLLIAALNPSVVVHMYYDGGFSAGLILHYAKRHQLNPMFAVYAHKGFQVTFQNGYKVSVMFGAGNYCEHHHNQDVEPSFPPRSVKIWEEHKSDNAEIAVIKPNGDFHSLLLAPINSCEDYVRGWCTPEEVLKVMNWAASLN
jgi:hypothetical protein